MFATEYYCLVAGLKEYSLDADTKGFDAKAIVGEILDGVSASDAAQVRLLYGYYDCENIASLRAGRSAHNPLGNFTREELEEEVKAPKRLPSAVGRVLRAYADPEGEDAEEVDTAQRFETALFDAYYATCSRAKSRFLREWSEFDRTLRNVTAAESGREGAQDRPDPLERGHRAGDVRLFRHQYHSVLSGARQYRGPLDATGRRARS